MIPDDELHARRAVCKHWINLMTRGLMIPFFGAGVNLTNRPPDTPFLPRGKYLPSGYELSKYLADKAEYPWGDADLMRVAWYAAYSEKFGKDLLYDHLNTIFGYGNYPLTDAHKFFASLPKRLAEKGYTKKDRYQLIVTTNYDNLLEQAFEKANEPYDLFSYVVHGINKGRSEAGKFRYKPHKGDPEIVWKPDEFIAPMEHTVILKIHGAVNRHDPLLSSYVITEDDYIDYLALLKPEGIPLMLKEKMLHRRFLFMGYKLSDWNLKVLLRSIKAESYFKDPSWAIMKVHDEWDFVYWLSRNVRLIKQPLKVYIDTLDEQLDEFPRHEGD